MVFRFIRSCNINAEKLIFTLALTQFHIYHFIGDNLLFSTDSKYILIWSISLINTNLLNFMFNLVDVDTGVVSYLGIFTVTTLKGDITICMLFHEPGTKNTTTVK